jgi:hypothetical protein
MASVALAATTLGLAIASDVISCQPTLKLILAVVAFVVHFLAGLVLFLLSSCGCRLCCACAPDAGACNRTAQATSAIGVSLCLWFLAGAAFIYGIVRLLPAALAAVHLGAPSDPDPAACQLSLLLAPPGLAATAGILAAASLLLQGHFVSLVPEALRNLAPPGPTAPQSPPVDPPIPHSQPPPAQPAADRPIHAPEPLCDTPVAVAVAPRSADAVEVVGAAVGAVAGVAVIGTVVLVGAAVGAVEGVLRGAAEGAVRGAGTGAAGVLRQQWSRPARPGPPPASAVARLGQAQPATLDSDIPVAIPITQSSFGSAPTVVFMSPSAPPPPAQD